MNSFLKVTRIATVLLVFFNNRAAYAESFGFVYTLSSNSFLSFVYPGEPGEGYIGAEGVGINDSGQIVGHYTASNNVSLPIHSFLKDGNTVTSFDFPGAYATEAHGINNSGQIVGTRITSATDVRAFLKDGNTFSSFAYPGATYTYGNGINNTGQIAGNYVIQVPTGPNGFRLFSHGLLIDGATLSQFDFPGSFNTAAYGINDAGQVVGFHSDSSSPYHGFIKDGEMFTSFDFPGGQTTLAFGINNWGQIVGSYSDNMGYHGFIKDGDLFTAINFPGAQFTLATGINDSGQIVGRYTPLPPAFVPEPNSLILLLTGLSGVIAVKFKRSSVFSSSVNFLRSQGR